MATHIWNVFNVQKEYKNLYAKFDKDSFDNTRD